MECNVQEVQQASHLRVAVVGLGYVGLPLAVAAAEAGIRVSGVDLNTSVVASLNDGRSHIGDVTNAQIASARDAGFAAHADFGVIADCDVIVICVPTPLDDNGGPDLSAVLGAAQQIVRHLQPSALVVLESTTYPGTTEEVLRPELESTGYIAGTDFHLAFSPERIDPGNEVFGITNTPKVVGGLTPECARRASDFYSRFIDDIVLTKSTREAEMAKLLENTYRHVNIALVNEMAVFCNDLDIDLWDSIRAASSKPFGFQAFWPGPGVGGHCIPIDPNYLSFKVRTLGYPFRFVELAQEISERMPAYVVSRSQALLNDASLSVRGSRILLAGVTYKANVADERESPSLPIAMRFLNLGAEVTYVDPYVEEWVVDGQSIQRTTLDSGLDQYDLVVLLQAHAEFLDYDFTNAHVKVFDTRGVLTGPNIAVL